MRVRYVLAAGRTHNQKGQVKKMADDLEDVKKRIEECITRVETLIDELEVLKDLAGSGEIDSEWMKEIEERVAKNEAVVERLQKKFSI
ncbi:hypothetical protein ES705_11639 [subsurface metagenome]